MGSSANAFERIAKRASDEPSALANKDDGVVSSRPSCRPYTLDTLRLPDGSITDNKYAIHKMCTDFFRQEWFANKAHLNFGFHKQSPNISRLMTDEDFFISEHASLHIPEHFVRLVWRTIQPPVAL